MEPENDGFQVRNLRNSRDLFSGSLRIRFPPQRPGVILRTQPLRHTASNSPETIGGSNDPLGSIFKFQGQTVSFREGTGMSMVLSKWIITPIKVGCKFRK